jgi:hypothetical protein
MECPLHTWAGWALISGTALGLCFLMPATQVKISLISVGIISGIGALFVALIAAGKQRRRDCCGWSVYMCCCCAGSHAPHIQKVLDIVEIIFKPFDDKASNLPF